MASASTDQAAATTTSAPVAVPQKKSKNDDTQKSTSPTKKGVFDSLKKKLNLKGKDKEGKEGKQAAESDDDATPKSSSTAVPTTSPSNAAPAETTSTTQRKHVPPQITTSPSPPQHSPNRTHSPTAAAPLPFTSQSPRLSPSASNQIFERNVQDPVHRPASPSNAIPAHIQTEDHIPPVLEASSLMITNDQISPDSVEIVTQRAHLSASATLSSHPATLPPASNTSPGSTYSPASSTTHNSPEMRAINSPYLTSDDHSASGPSSEDLDKRRLSFISFADVVQAEHIEAVEEDMIPPAVIPPAQNIASISETLRGRSPSPAFGAQDMGRSLSSRSSIQGQQQPPQPEGLVVETMGQALRRTGSGDLKGDGIAALSL